MRSIIFLIILLSNTSVFSQSREEGEVQKFILSGKEFKSNGSCFESKDKETYDIYGYDRSENGFDWGHFISFTDSTFSTHYSAPCGNDCFTSVSGRYSWKGSDKIEVYVSSISRSGFCQLQSENPEEVFGTYQIEETAVGYQFLKL